MNIFFAVIVGILASFCVMLFSYKYYVRKNFFLALSRFLDEIELNLSFLKDDLHKLTKNFSSNSLKFDDVLKAYESFLDTSNNAEFETKILSFTFLNDDEKQKVLDYFKKLGRSDCSTQNDLTKAMQKYVLEKMDVCKSDVSKKANLVQKLSVIFGLFVIILLV